MQTSMFNSSEVSRKTWNFAGCHREKLRVRFSCFLTNWGNDSVAYHAWQHRWTFRVRVIRKERQWWCGFFNPRLWLTSPLIFKIKNSIGCMLHINSAAFKQKVILMYVLGYLSFIIWIILTEFNKVIIWNWIFNSLSSEEYCQLPLKYLHLFHAENLFISRCVL